MPTACIRSFLHGFLFELVWTQLNAWKTGFKMLSYTGAYTGRFPACPGTTLKDGRVCLPEVRGRKSSLRSLDYTISYFRLSWICTIMKRCPRGQSKLDVFFGRKRILLAGSTVLDGRGQSVSCREPPKLESRVRHCYIISHEVCRHHPVDTVFRRTAA